MEPKDPVFPLHVAVATKRCLPSPIPTGFDINFQQVLE